MTPSHEGLRVLDLTIVLGLAHPKIGAVKRLGRPVKASGERTDIGRGEGVAKGAEVAA